MKAEHRKELETNSLAEGVSTFVDRAKTGKLWDYRAIALVLALVAIGGVWWYAIRASRKANSMMWSSFEEVKNPSDLKAFADAHKDTVAAKLARVEYARTLLGADGLGRLASQKTEDRTKGVENIEAAREEFLKLADEFKKDTTLQATCLTSAAEAELALVGYPKGATLETSEPRGSVDKAAELYRKTAKIVGEKTTLGENFLRRATELEEKKKAVVEAESALTKLLPEKTNPRDTTPAPKAPEGLFPSPKLPDVVNPADSPKAPAGPVTVPPVPTPPATPAAAPGTPVPAPTPAGSTAPPATPAPAPKSPATPPAAAAPPTPATPAPPPPAPAAPPKDKDSGKK
ncbi:hypothetical protein [Fimbriiglobus ruber]|uniref:Extensin-like protein n=1 Tax=Fimbriiglobus ruber TaxID=1908690 RepID=A0A225EEP5_9BACT|nr:hypothetical protein [Fimbriiglobus ruber]OWK46825.1 Extensin-like protein precursor [Fimbriiglobus ruber]